MIEALKGGESLRKVALTAYYGADREKALRRLQEAFQDEVPGVIEAHAKIQSRAQVLANETDNNKLLESVQSAEFDTLRIVAAQRLSDPVALLTGCIHLTDRDVLKIMLNKVCDSTSLNRIAAEAVDRPMQLAAARMSGAKSWADVFKVATNRGATPEMLGDALAAVSLFQDVQQDATEAVQQACLNLIRLGNESRIPEMVDLLDDYGDKVLAEDYLNCGQPDLDSAARSWAGQHGYSVGSGYGSNRARWGAVNDLVVWWTYSCKCRS